MIHNKEPIEVLYDYVKQLAEEIPIFKEVMANDDNSVPQTYILLKSQISDSTSLYGDGKSQIRSADCDILLVTKGYDSATYNTNKRKIRECLKSNDIDFNESNLGFDSTSGTTQHNFSMEVDYIA